MLSDCSFDKKKYSSYPERIINTFFIISITDNSAITLNFTKQFKNMDLSISSGPMSRTQHTYNLFSATI